MVLVKRQWFESPPKSGIVDSCLSLSSGWVQGPSGFSREQQTGRLPPGARTGAAEGAGQGAPRPGP